MGSDSLTRYGLTPLADMAPEELARFVPAVACRNRDKTIRAFTVVDPEDRLRIASRRWSIGTRGYPRRKVTNPDGTHSYPRLHREIMGLKPGDPFDVDHINGDKLDNRKANLRICTRQQNLQNRLKITGTSKYRGVSWDPERQMFRAQATINYRNHFLGRYATEEEAAGVVRRFREANMPFATN